MPEDVADPHQKAHLAPTAPPPCLSPHVTVGSPVGSLSAWRGTAMQPGGVSANDTKALGAHAPQSGRRRAHDPSTNPLSPRGANPRREQPARLRNEENLRSVAAPATDERAVALASAAGRSEEHTSELQSRSD